MRSYYLDLKREDKVNFYNKNRLEDVLELVDFGKKFSSFIYKRDTSSRLIDLPSYKNLSLCHGKVILRNFGKGNGKRIHVMIEMIEGYRYSVEGSLVESGL